MNVCVYCGSSPLISDVYVDAADRLGRALARRGHGLVYGGGAVGLMGVVARAVHGAGGHVYGVIPEALRVREGIAYEIADELVVTETMGERKRLMFTRADAFVVLPGGIGTLEEFFEVLTLRALGYHDKPIALVSTTGFYTDLVAFLERLRTDGFVRAGDSWGFDVAETAEAALDFVERQARPAGAAPGSEAPSSETE